MKIYFIRHGQSNYNQKNLCNDDPSIDVHLTELGKRQAKEAAEKLKDKKFDVIYVSELPRTLETAKIINKFHNAEIKVERRINDRKSGFEGKPERDFLKAVEKDIFNTRVNDGESFLDEKKRIFSFLNDLKKIHCENVLVVCHEDTLKIADGYFNDLSDEEIWAREFGNCEMLEIEV